jgi:hypothetical protein
MGRKEAFLVIVVVAALMYHSPVLAQGSPTVIYDEALASQWSDQSYGATNNFANTSPVYQGTYSANITLAMSGAMILRHQGNLSPSSYDRFQFRIHGGTVGVTPFAVTLDGPYPAAYPDIFFLQGLPANQWHFIDLAMSDLDPSGQVFNAVAIIELSAIPGQHTYYVDNIVLTPAGSTSVTLKAGATPLRYGIGQNFPNPFNPSTTIEFQIPKSGRATLTVHTLLGQEVATLVSRDLAPGTYSVRWDASGVASGVYLYRLLAGDFVATRRLVVEK